jgi:hypothetical protein
MDAKVKLRLKWIELYQKLQIRSNFKKLKNEPTCKKSLVNLTK